jgi:hypothetical protein
MGSPGSFGSKDRPNGPGVLARLTAQEAAGRQRSQCGVNEILYLGVISGGSSPAVLVQVNRCHQACGPGPPPGWRSWYELVKAHQGDDAGNRAVTGEDQPQLAAFCYGPLMGAQQDMKPAGIAEPGAAHVHHDRRMPADGRVEENAA